MGNQKTAWEARFVYQRDYIAADGRVKWKAFFDRRPPHNTSVDEHKLKATDIHWDAGAKINPNRPLRGAADIPEHEISRLGFTVLRTPSPLNRYHAEIFGWPAGDTDVDLRECMAKAASLADASVFVAAPETAQEGEK